MLKNVSLSPKEVIQPVYVCQECHNKIKVIPSCITSGSILTIKALIYIIFIYQSTTITWRELTEQLCPEHDRLAHSTLYKGAHRIGETLKVHPLMCELSIKLGDEQEAFPPRTRYLHTREREKPLRKLSSMLISGTFITIFSYLVKRLNRLSRRISKLSINKLAHIYPYKPLHNMLI